MSTPGAFSAATGVRPEGDGRWSASIAEGWDIAGNANGGYLLAIAARAVVAEVGRPDPVTVTGHYLAPGRPGPVTVDTAVVKEGKRFATASATLSDDTRPLLAVLATLGELGVSGDELYVAGAPPDLPAVAECIPIEGTDTFPPPFMSRVELRIHPEDAGFRNGEPSGTPRVRGWFRLRDGEPVDTVALLCAVDAFPPTVFNARLPVAWTPTVELTAHVRARPAPGWLACSFRTRFVTGGFLEADGEVWDATGTLVAQSRQLALVPREPGA
ncbi:MAG: thioesterase family protein [Microthrixaceae bacterium]